MHQTSVHCYVIGDGTTPRTGLMFLSSTRWKITVVDPAMKTSWISGHLDNTHGLPARFEVAAKKGEDIKIQQAGIVVILNIHSHANLPAIVENNQGVRNMWVLTIPCCFPSTQTLPTVTPHATLVYPTLQITPFKHKASNKAFIYLLNPDKRTAELVQKARTGQNQPQRVEEAKDQRVDSSPAAASSS